MPEPEKDLFGDPVARLPVRKRARPDTVSNPAPKAPERAPLTSREATQSLQPSRFLAGTWFKGRSAKFLLSVSAAISAVYFSVPAPVREGSAKFLSEKVTAGLSVVYDKALGHHSAQPSPVSRPPKPIESGTISVPEGEVVSRTPVEQPTPPRASKPIQTGSISVTEAQRPKAKATASPNPKSTERETKGPIATIIQFFDQLLTFGKSAGPP